MTPVCPFNSFSPCRENCALCLGREKSTGELLCSFYRLAALSPYLVEAVQQLPVNRK